MKIPQPRYFNYPKFVRAAAFLFTLLAVFAIVNVSAKNITGGPLVESFLESQTNLTLLKSLSPLSTDKRAELSAAEIIPAAISESAEQSYFARTAFFLKLSNTSEPVEPESLGNYPATNVALSGNILVTPDAAPTGTTSINVSTNTNFKGQFVGDSATGVIRVTNAHPSGTYPVTVTANGPGGLVTKTFNLTVSVTPACSGIWFGPRSDAPSTNQPTGLAIGDFNRDGIQDLVSSTANTSTQPLVGFVAVQMGDGNGGFSTAANFPVNATLPYAIAVGDFNRDGKPDVATANWGDSSMSNLGNVSVLIGDGNGGFGAATILTAGFSPDSIVVGDFNGDRKEDLAVGNANSQNVSILLGNGEGGFAATVNFATGWVPSKIAVADLNADGKQDLVTFNGWSFGAGSVSILIGNGVGGFAAPVNYALPIGQGSFLIADLNEDGKQDIAVAVRGLENGPIDDVGPGRVSILFGNGSGGFAPPVDRAVGLHPTTIALVDFNGDGKHDLVVSNERYSGPVAYSISILLATGQGNFAAPQNINVDRIGTDIAVGDFNSDGKQDVVVSSAAAMRAFTLLRTCIPQYTISGRITRGSMAGDSVLVSLSGSDNRNTITDSNGNYSFSNVAEGGNYIVTPSLFGFIFTPSTRTITNIQSNQVADFASTQAFSISGRITVGGVGLSGIAVNVSGTSSGATTTDSSGSYSFPNLTPGGNYLVTPSSPGHTFNPTNRNYTNLQAPQVGDFAATQIITYSISGQITQNGSGLSGVTLTVNGMSSSSTSTDSNGNYSLTGLVSGGNYTVLPMKAGFSFAPTTRSYTNLSANQSGNFLATAIPIVAGGLDLDYNAGVQNPNFIGFLGDGRVQAIAIQPDGKHIIAGNFSTANSTGRSNIARFYPDGTLDESFDPGVGFPGGYAIDIALQPDGKIIVGGNLTSFTNAEGVFSKFGIVRLNSDGSLDNLFNPGQGVRSAPNTSGTVKTVVRQPDGKILIGGQFLTVDGVARSNIARLNTDGSLDQSFAVGTGAAGIVEAIALQPDGKVVIGGELTAYNGTVVNRLIRVDSVGVLDPAFNIGTGPNAGVITALKAQPDGKILVGGSFSLFNNTTARWVARLNTNGSRDGFLEGSGACPATCSLVNPAQQFSVLANGQIYISSGGTVNANGNAWGGTILRYNADGGRDSLFNPPNETIASPLPMVNRHAVQADGSVIGTHGRYLNFPLIDGGPFSNIRRLTTTGTVDVAYQPMLGDVGNNNSGSYVADVALQADGKLIVGGNFSIANNKIRYDVARFNTNGSLDETFNYTFTGQTIFKVLPLPGGKTIVCGQVEVGASNRIGIARLNSNGSFDNTFIGSVSPGGAVFGAALQADGKIIIVGRFSQVNGVARSGIARLHPDGAIDDSFTPGTGLTVPGGGQEPYDVTVLPDGNIVVIGFFTAYNGTARAGLVRIQSNGNIDPNFTPTGQDFATYRSLAQLPNGQLLAGGGALRRINTNGSIDQSFAGVPAFNIGAITDIRVLGSGNILIGGTFETQTGPRRAGLARILPNGGIDPSFGNNLRGADTGTPGLGGIAVDEANNHIYFGGNFHAYNNVGRGSVARVFLNTTVTTVAVTVNTNPAGRSFTVDGTTYSSPQNFNWESGSAHTIATVSPQAGAAGTQYVWANWNDSGAISHTVSPTSDTTYTANFTTQHQLTMNSSAGGTVSPASGFYNAGQSVQITATPNAGFTFANWTGTGNGSYSGTNNPASVTMNAPVTQTANFNVQCSYALNPTQTNISAAGGNGSFNVTAPAGCAWSAASNAAWLTTSSANSGNGTVNYTVAANLTAARSATITVGGQIFTVNQAANTRRSPFDFDGDGKTDVGIFRPSDGSWWYVRSTDSQFRVFSFGSSTDRIVPADYTGDGKTDLAVFRASTGEWFIQRSDDNSYFSFPFGASGDIPAPADYDGDGRADAAVYRPSSGTWFILNSSGSGISIIGFGTPEDKPVPADFDGDGKADIAIFRPSDGSWWYLRSSDSQFRVFRFGVSTDKPVQADYTGDGKADLAVWRPSTGEWFIQRSEDNSYYSIPFGTSGDLPVPGDYDGDGKTDTAVFRPSNSTWFLNQTTAGVGIVTFGITGDRPVPNAFVP